MKGSRAGEQAGTGVGMKLLIEETVTGDKQLEDEGGRTVVVGITMDAGSRELLTWALVNVAETGDRVIALHVIRSSAAVLDSEMEPSPLISVVKELTDMLAGFEGFCNLKKIDLKLKISRGSSIRRVLVQEVSLFSASKFIVGISKKTQGLSYYSITVAKYCAKKLSGSCSVLAVNNGKIVFQNGASGDSGEEKLSYGSEFVRYCKIYGQSGKDGDPARHSFRCLPSASIARLGCDKIYSYAAYLSSRFYLLKNENCPAHDSAIEPLCSPVSGEKSDTSSESGEGSFNSVSMNDNESPGCVLVWELPQRGPGWTLLRRAFLRDKKNSFQAKLDAVSRSGCIAKVEDMSPVIPTEFQFLRDKCSNCRMFSFKELERATSNFSPDNIIGKGGNSRVYKGCISDKKELAVKIVEHSDEVMKNFISEIEIMSKLHHKNIISLVGFCFENSYMLVYDFLSRGSLEGNLHGCKRENSFLCWTERYKIAVGVAEALEYLHKSSSTQPVIHRDVKSSNILLSDDFEPKLSDFGLAQLSSSSIENMTCTELAGTFGYLAPECFTYGKVDEKVDVYAFGVVLLELLSGRKPVCSDCPKGEESLVLWVKPFLKAWNLKEVLDSCLGENFNTDEMESMCLAALLCIKEAPGHRPDIAFVVKLLNGDDEAIGQAKLELGASMVPDDVDDEEATNNSDIRSHLNLALLDIDDDDELLTSSGSHSFGFAASNISLDMYLKEMSSRSSSFS